MANEEHLAILKQGVEVWNKWRGENLTKTPDLWRADLRDVDLSGVDLAGAALLGADLRDARLSESKLMEAILCGANLQGADLKKADLSFADFRNTNLSGADLRETDLYGVDLFEAVLDQARMAGTGLSNVDLRDVIRLENVKHDWSSSLGLDTIFKSKGKIPEVFLRGCGLSDYQIEIANLAKQGMDRDEVTAIAYNLVNMYCGDGIQYYSCFISYNSEDQAFAQKLHDDLQENGVRCWFAPEDMKIGDRIRPRIDDEIRLRDKLLVILSENSIESEWVGDEVEAALEEERGSGRTILFPVRLDDAVLKTRSDWAAKIKRRRHIGDFQGWDDEGKYQKGFERLLRDLKADGE